MDDYRDTLYLMGTKITLYVKGQDAKALIDEAGRRLNHYEQVFSANSQDSQLAHLKQYGAQAPQPVDPELYDLIKIGHTHSLETDSFLNIAIGPLIKLWRIGFKEARVPSSEEVEAILPLLRPDNILLNDSDHSVYFTKEGTEIDLGAIAKGYFSDRIMAYFLEHNVESAMIDIGGNVLVHGPSPKGAPYWQVGIQNPFQARGQVVASLAIRNQSVVTSGIYERTFEHGGHTYHHIFDAHTGYPVETDMASLTIVANDSIDCDLYTTKLFGLDIRSIIRRVNAIDGMGAMVITKEGQMAITHNLKERITFA